MTEGVCLRCRDGHTYMELISWLLSFQNPLRWDNKGILMKLSVLHSKHGISSVQSLSCVRLCYPMNRSTPSLPVHHQLPESIQTHVHRVGDAIQPSHPVFPSPPALNLSQHQGLFQWVSSSHQVAKVLELQLHHQSFQWIFRTDLL